MSSNSQPIEIGNINQLRTILYEMENQNTHTIQHYLNSCLEDQHFIVKQISAVCLEQLSKKQQNLQNVIKFSLHVLNELQNKIQLNAKVNEQLSIIQQDFSKLLSYNEDLLKRIEQIQNQNFHYKSKIEEAQTYISQVSQSDYLKSSLQNLSMIQINNLEIPFLLKHRSHLTERSPLSIQNKFSIEEDFMTKQQFNSKVTKFQEIIESKSFSILALEDEVQRMRGKIHNLQNELHLKASQLQLSELYFKQKIDIIANNEATNRSRQISFSELQMNTIFKKELSRVSSSKSIESIDQSQNSSDHSFNQQEQKVDYGQVESSQSYSRKNTMRRSLMQDFVTDFVVQSQQYSSVLNLNSMIDSQNNSIEISRERKKSVSISTADIRKYSTKGVQTNISETNPQMKFIRKNLPPIIKKQDKKQHQSSFLGFGSITSLFSKKKSTEVKNQFACKQVDNCILKDLDLTFQAQVEQSNQSSIGDIFKGIFEYATKKIVTNRVHKKNRNSGCLNQSMIIEQGSRKGNKYNSRARMNTQRN